MPRLTTTNSLYKFTTSKLCHPMRICAENLSYWSVNDWYGQPCAKHVYYITLYEEKAHIRYESDYWYSWVINKYA